MLNIDVIQWVNDADRCYMLKLNAVYMTHIDENKISIMIIENWWCCGFTVECISCKRNMVNTSCNHISSMDIGFIIQNNVIVIKQRCEVTNVFLVKNLIEIIILVECVGQWILDMFDTPNFCVEYWCNSMNKW